MKKPNRQFVENVYWADQEFAKNVVSLAKSFNIGAQLIGKVEESEKKELVIDLAEKKLEFGDCVNNESVKTA